MKQLIYADHAATTRLSPAALKAMMPFLQGEYGNPSSLHSWAKGPRRAVAESRKIIAGCINAKPEQIVFTSGGTESDNWVIKQFAREHISVSAFEHHAVLNSWESVGDFERGMVYPCANGIVDIDRYYLHTYLEPKEREVIGLASLMLANNEIGTIQPVRDLVKRARKSVRSRTVCVRRVHTDAVQAVGNIPVDVKDLDVDFLSASGHKFNGPRGVGFLYVKDPSTLSPYIDGGQQEFGVRAGTENVASIVGMAVALRENIDGLDASMKHKRMLAEMLRERISTECPAAVFNGDFNHVLPGFVSVGFHGKNAEAILQILDLKGIAVSTGAACDSKNTQISHVLKAIGLDDELAKGTIRITLGKENTVADVDEIVKALRVAKAFK